ncbi:MAG: hypothetical protein QOI66_1458, partial [Myxococcales bacterium]|nr:hypothetical protein [Myxococcales bacterium]
IRSKGALLRHGGRPARLAGRRTLIDTSATGTATASFKLSRGPLGSLDWSNAGLMRPPTTQPDCERHSRALASLPLRPNTTSGTNRSRRLGSTLWRLLPLVPLVALTCGPSNLPNDQLLSSPHFRYHARADTVVDPTIIDRLEAHRSQLDGYLDVDSGIIDYYRFPDSADRQASTGCNDDCTHGRSIFAFNPFQEHELVHALLADVNQAAPVLEEGMAQYLACLWPRTTPTTPPADWPGIGAPYIWTIDRPDIVYAFGQRLVSWMSQTGGRKKLVDFYRGSLMTSDAAVFALQFERFWNRRLSDVAGELLDQRFAGSFCPCAAPAVPPDGSPTSFVAGQDYRTLDIGQESRLELSSDGPRLIFPFACANSIVDGPDPPEVLTTGTALTVARVGPGRYGVTAESFSGETITVRQTQRAMSDWTCQAAATQPIALGNREVTAWVTPDFASDETWFAFNLDRPAVVDILNPETDFAICPSCTPGPGCIFSFSVQGTGVKTVGATTAGPLFIRLLVARGQPATNLGLRVRPFL